MLTRLVSGQEFSLRIASLFCLKKRLSVYISESSARKEVAKLEGSEVGCDVKFFLLFLLDTCCCYVFMDTKQTIETPVSSNKGICLLA